MEIHLEVEYLIPADQGRSSEPITKWKTMFKQDVVTLSLRISQNTANLPYLLTFGTTGYISDPVPPPATWTSPNYSDVRFTACKLGEAFAKINLSSVSYLRLPSDDLLVPL
ncbi:hypothetical protein FocTR4_00007131 [Fusarium oxysporum f. sp. cubense]|uniref:Uncharacterized protein n=1 Tax=Fusarium oxysporum f. sp. cubense TaxID=61366 RepID=A0A5C6TLQ1_FUSOC|nr:hypothetical protein FocTR4_00007131 [Fusarium oxysporum f. sp. cubense]